MSNLDAEIVILGAGASGLMLAERLAARKDQAPRVILVEPRITYANDQTWSFWRVAPHAFEPLVEGMRGNAWHGQRPVGGRPSALTDTLTNRSPLAPFSIVRLMRSMVLPGSHFNRDVPHWPCVSDRRASRSRPRTAPCSPAGSLTPDRRRRLVARWCSDSLAQESAPDLHRSIRPWSD